MMKKLLIGAAVAARWRRRVRPAAPAQRQEVHVRAGAEEHEQPVLRPGARRLQEGREGARTAQFKCLYIGPGEHGGGDEQVQVVHDLIAKKVDGIAVSPANAAAMGKALERRQGGRHPGPDLGQRPARQGQGAAHRLCRHAQLRHRRQPRQAGAGDQAEGRHDLHPVRRRGGGQPQRAHAGHPRHARRRQERARRPATG